MDLDIDVIDAFTDKRFGGNPAAVIITEFWLSEELMQSIARENNLSETAFLVPLNQDEPTCEKEARYEIRWFSPITEIAFCGHATLASAFVLFTRNPRLDIVYFNAKAVGTLPVVKLEDGSLQMDFPNTRPESVSEIPRELLEGLSITPLEVLRNEQAYFVVYNSEADVLKVERDNEILKRLKPYDVAVTALSDSNQYDFVSRYFWPANGGDEDPVTGSIHTALAPFWAERLGKKTLTAFQASSRGGILHCTVSANHRVLISGTGVQYLKGKITV